MGSIFRKRKISTLKAIDRFDFCRGISPPKTGNRIKDNPIPRFRQLHYTAKPSALLRRLIVGYGGATRPAPATSFKEQDRL